MTGRPEAGSRAWTELPHRRKSRREKQESAGLRQGPLYYRAEVTSGQEGVLPGNFKGTSAGPKNKGPTETSQLYTQVGQRQDHGKGNNITKKES